MNRFNDIKDRKELNATLKAFISNVRNGHEINVDMLNFLANAMERYIDNPKKDCFALPKGKRKPNYELGLLLAITESFECSIDKVFKDLEKSTKEPYERLKSLNSNHIKKAKVDFHKNTYKAMIISSGKDYQHWLKEYFKVLQHN